MKKDQIVTLIKTDSKIELEMTKIVEYLAMEEGMEVAIENEQRNKEIWFKYRLKKGKLSFTVKIDLAHEKSLLIIT